MNAYQSGSDFSFMTNTSAAVFHPVAFGAHRCHGNEVQLHSHLGKGFSGLGNEQVPPYAFWSTLCVGYRLLRDPFHSFLCV
jgi:hypothetical protein